MRVIHVHTGRKGDLVRVEGCTALVKLEGRYARTSTWPDGLHRFDSAAVRPIEELPVKVRVKVRKR